MTDHERKRAKIAADLDAFRKRGGRIKRIPDGVSGDPWNAQASRPNAQQRLTARYTLMLTAPQGSGSGRPWVARIALTGTYPCPVEVARVSCPSRAGALPDPAARGRTGGSPHQPTR